MYSIESRSHVLCDRDTSISLLRIWLTFLVVTCHIHPGTSSWLGQAVAMLSGCAVPGFVFLSFYLTWGHDFTQPEYLRKRLKRIYYPVLIWTLILFILWNTAFWVTGYKDKMIHGKAIIYSFLFGSVPLMGQLWYNCVMVALICGVVILHLLVTDDRHRLYVYGGLFLGAFYLEYSGINMYLVGSAVWEARWTLGRFIECIPAAVAGIAWYYLAPRFKRCEIYLLAFGCIIAWYGVNTLSPILVERNFGYAGIERFFLSVGMVLMILHFPKIRCSRFALAVNWLGFYATSVYYEHFFVGTMLQHLLQPRFPWLEGALEFDVLIFVLCILISVIFATLIRKKSVVLYLFH